MHESTRQPRVNTATDQKHSKATHVPPALERPRLSADNITYQVMGIERELFSDHETREADSRLNRLMGSVQAALDLPANRNLSVEKKILQVYETIQKQGYKLDPDTKFRSETLTQNLLDRKLDCDTSSMIVLGAAQHNRWNDVALVRELGRGEESGHAWIRHAGKNFDYGYATDDNWYIKEYGKIPKPCDEDSIKASAHRRVGSIKSELGDHASAARSFQQAVKLDPGNARYRFFHGSKEMDLGNVADAANSLQKAAELEPADGVYRAQLGLAYAQLKDHKSAVQSLQKAVELDPARAAYRFLLGVELSNLGDYQNAAKSLQNAINLAPTNAVYQYFQGRTEVKLEDFTSAAKSFQRAAELKPSEADYRYELGLVYSELGDHQTATTHLQAAVDLKPDNPGYRFSLGATHYELKDFTSAASCFQEALNLEPENSLYGLYLDMTKSRLNDTSAAITNRAK